MLIFRYSKIEGAEFISHLDTLRHLQKTILRAKIPVEYSKGFNPHMQIYMSAPIAVGLKSYAEYCVVETTMPASEFMPKFNEFAPGGFHCTVAKDVSKRHNIQALMDGAEYYITGLNAFDTAEFLSKTEFYITDKHGETREVRDRIKDLKFVTGSGVNNSISADNRLIARLSFGNATLRPDIFADELKKIYGGGDIEITKVNATIDGVIVEEALN